MEFAESPAPSRPVTRAPPETIVDEALGCVDFLPTILALMGVSDSAESEGRDASQLLRTGKAPEGWRDLSFVRGTGNGEGSTWLAAVTDRYKLIYFHDLNEWELYDLEKDPQEVNNVYTDPAYAKQVKELKGKLSQLKKQYKDNDKIAEWK